MTKKNDQPIEIPSKPFNGHPAGPRWYTETYQKERTQLSGLSDFNLKNASRAIDSSPASSEQHARAQAVKHELASRKKD